MNYSTYQQKTPPHTRCQVVMFDPEKVEPWWSSEINLYLHDIQALIKDYEALKVALDENHPTALIRNEDGSHTVLARDVFELSYEPVN